MLHIGLTYDDREAYLAQGLTLDELAECERPETITAIENALLEMGHRTERIGNATALLARLAAGERWQVVFNIAEGIHGFGRESLIPCLLDAYQIPYTFADPLVLSLTLHKAMCKRVLRDLGLPTADFCEIKSVQELETMALVPPLFVKPVAQGSGLGLSRASLVSNHDALRAVTTDLLTRFAQPVLLEAFLPGREFIVGIVGTGPRAQSVGVLEVQFGGDTATAHVYAESTDGARGVSHTLLTGSALSQQVETIALACWRGLGCRDGGRVDIRLDAAGNPMIMEVNAIAGLDPQEGKLPLLARVVGWPYTRLIEAILDGAIDRMPHHRTRAKHPG